MVSQPSPVVGAAAVSSSSGVTTHMNPVKGVQDKWQLLPAFLKLKGLVKQHIDSYNHFVQFEMKNIVRANANRIIKSDVDPAFFIEFLDIRVGEPRLDESMVALKLTPALCRNRDLSYASPVFVDVDFLNGDQVTRRKNVEIGRIPVMLRSCVCVLHGKSPNELQALGECPHDPGGYFVVKGTEKVILMQEQLSKNRIIVEHDFKKCISACVTSSTSESKSRCQVVFKPPALYFRHNSFVDDIPLCVVIKALGVETDQEMFQMIGTGELDYEVLSCSLQAAQDDGVFTQRAALLYMGKRVRQKVFVPRPGSTAVAPTPPAKRNDRTVIEETRSLLNRVVLSHIESTTHDFKAKIRVLSLMSQRVLEAVKDITTLDDRDYLGNKRLELAGQLVALMFEDLFKRFCTQTKKQADQSLARYLQSKSGAASSGKAPGLGYPDCFRTLPTDIITRGMQTALSTGNWTIKRFRMERSGVSQVLSRFSFIASLGMMTRMNSQFEKGRKVSGPRALQPSQWGVLCPCDTPEGESCGLVKNLSLMTHVTTEDDQKPIIKTVFALGVEDASSLTGEELHDKHTDIVFLNGNLLGVHRYPKQLIANIRHLRRHGKLGQFVSVCENQKQRCVFIASDEGRLCRPLIIVEHGHSRLRQEHMDMLRNGEMNFADFLRTGIIEWVDVNEENNCLIALRDAEIVQDTTHVEIDPLTMMGVIAGLVPYPNHNQSPRNTYQCAMGKQAMGAIAFNQFNRCDTVLYLLVYPQRPLVKTRTIELIGYEQLPAGQNAMVAVMSYSGYDIEDAIVMNRDSIDRGFGRCMLIKKAAVELKKYLNGTADVVFPPPSPAKPTGKQSRGVTVQNRRFQMLDDDGVARVGELVSEDQVYINKYSPINKKEHTGNISRTDISQYRPTPAVFKKPVPAYIDRVVYTENHEATQTFKIMMRMTRRPEYGDKFSSRHGQKGVVGLIVPQQDLPFSDTGWTPDLIMNPHGFPSRMTVGKMLELLGGKSAVLDGKFKYGTAFGGTKVEDIGEVLIEYGYHYSGKEYLTSGITGEALETYVFIGPIFYQKLKHMVQDKIHARGRGPRQILTRQPTEGRAKEGGLRLGEMERDCLVAYGASNLLLERLMLSSDVYHADVCSACGYMGYDGWCPFCKSDGSVATLRLPYACKLLFQEMQAMNVSCRLILKTDF
eukprot:Lankesteria_metandrocarpae@DN5237_c0_g1_i3.p1